jgi:hypothetical protein
MAAPKDRSIITDKLVVEKTGNTMETWFRLLDKFGAKKMDHTAIFNFVKKTDGLDKLGEWNQNLLATSYEWSRGLKERGEKKDGFEISISKTIDVPVNALYKIWVEESSRLKWLNEKILIRKSTTDKSARITWSDAITSLSVDFYSKAANKSQVVVQHIKIADSKKAAALKLYWNEMLEKLKTLLEK